MGKVVVTEFVSLDGVFEDPGGAEGFKYGGWSFKFQRGPEGDKFKLDELKAAGAHLLGRITYEDFAKAWPTIKDEAGFADMMNNLPKYVVSSSLNEGALTWKNSHVIKADLASEVTKLKQEIKGDLLVAGSGQLVRGLLGAGLVDEIHLMTYPVILGEGKRLFDGAAKTDLQLVGQKTLDNGVTVLSYAPVKV